MGSHFFYTVAIIFEGIHMSIAEKIRESSERDGKKFRKDDNFLKTEEFYKKAIESGIAKKPEYKLPQIDTICATLSTTRSFQDE